MKKLIKLFLIFVTLICTNNVFSQLEFTKNIGANYTNLNRLNVTDNLLINGNSNYYGANFSFEAKKNKFILGFDATLSNSILKSDTSKLNNSTIIASFLIGRQIDISSDYIIKVFAGYSYGSFLLNYSQQNTYNYSITSITGFDKIIHLNNSSHFISSKIKTELFDVIYVSIAYNISIKESSWKGTYSEVNNLPMDKFNNTSVSVGFLF